VGGRKARGYNLINPRRQSLMSVYERLGGRKARGYDRI
jgi:hypothetical protein